VEGFFVESLFFNVFFDWLDSCGARNNDDPSKPASSI